VALLVVRRGDDLRAYLNVCPHQYLPLTYRGERVLAPTGIDYAVPTTAPSSPCRTDGPCRGRAVGGD
jgi:hypothetical protein